jgi:hypothetical protein
MAKRTSLEVKQEAGAYAIWQDGRQLAEPLPGTSAWSIWLDERAIGSFGFTPQTGAHYTARREQRQRGGDYWYAYRKQEQRLRKVYAGRSAELTMVRLEQIALQFARGSVPERPISEYTVQEKVSSMPVQPVIATAPPRNPLATARDCAKDLIRFYVRRGDAIDDLAHGHTGSSNNTYHAHIGGLVRQPGAARTRDIGCWKLAVTRVGQQECCEIFDLCELYQEIQAETSVPVNTMSSPPGQKSSGKSRKNKEEIVTEILCASCGKPLSFPGYTLAEVYTRFRNQRCGLCLMPMMLQQKPQPKPSISALEPARQYVLLLGKALCYHSLLAAVADAVQVDEGETNWHSFVARADDASIVQATRQALHLCHMLDITPPVLPGQESISWCATIRERYDGWHDHRQPAAYQDRRGNHWCEACFARYEIMEMGESLGYPPTIALDTTLFVKIGYSGWLYFVQYAGNEAVFLVHRIVRRMYNAWKRGAPITACEHQPCRRTVYYQDFTGHSWCELHVLCFSIMRMGTALDYPAMPDWQIEAGEDVWLAYVQSEKREKMEGVLKHVRALLELAERSSNGSAEPLTQPFQAPKKATEYRVVEFAPIDGKRDTREQSRVTIHAGDTVEGVKEAIHLYWTVGQRKPYAELRLYRRGRRIYEYELKSDRPKV